MIAVKLGIDEDSATGPAMRAFSNDMLDHNDPRYKTKWLSTRTIIRTIILVYKMTSLDVPKR